MKVFRIFRAATEEARAACTVLASSKDVPPPPSMVDAFKKAPAAPSKLDQYLRPTPVKE